MKRIAWSGIVVSGLLVLLMLVLSQVYWQQLLGFVFVVSMVVLVVTPFVLLVSVILAVRRGKFNRETKLLMVAWGVLYVGALALIAGLILSALFTEHKGSVQLNGHVYHLERYAFSFSTGDTFQADPPPPVFYGGYVYECDATGFFCTRLAEIPPSRPFSLQVVDGSVQVVEEGGVVVWTSAP